MPSFRAYFFRIFAWGEHKSVSIPSHCENLSPTSAYHHELESTTGEQWAVGIFFGRGAYPKGKSRHWPSRNFFLHIVFLRSDVLWTPETRPR